MAGDGLPRAALVAQLRAWADDVRARWSGVGDVVAVAVDTIALATERRLRISLTELRPHTRGAPSGEWLAGWRACQEAAAKGCDEQARRFAGREAEHRNLAAQYPHAGESWRLAADESRRRAEWWESTAQFLRALQPTTPDPTPSSGEGEDPQDCRGCDGRGFTVGGDNEHYACRACQLPATPSRQKEE